VHLVLDADSIAYGPTSTMLLLDNNTVVGPDLFADDALLGGLSLVDNDAVGMNEIVVGLEMQVEELIKGAKVEKSLKKT